MDYSFGVFDECLDKAGFDVCLGKAGKWLANDDEIENFAGLMVAIFLDTKLNLGKLIVPALLELDESVLLFVLKFCGSPVPVQFHESTPARKYILATLLAKDLRVAYEHGFSTI